MKLIILVADKNMEYTILGLLTRHQSLGFHQLPSDGYKIIRYPLHDPGCRLRGYELLREYVGKAECALMLYDREGCGREDPSRVELETQGEEQLAQSGWGANARVIVIDPELENWVWSVSPYVDEVLGWKSSDPKLREWLVQKSFIISEDQVKPEKPKDALVAALRFKHRARSSGLYKKLAGKVGLRTCIDPAFGKLRSTLQTWFPIERNA